jgi:PKD repeat protein
MKKLLLPILFLLLVLPAIAQNYVQISGTVTDLANGNPIANQAVTISNDSSGGWIYYQTVFTNNSGVYIDTIPVPINTQGILYVRTFDCQNYMHQTVVTFMPALLVFTVDFNICYNSSPCAAGFLSSQSQPLAVQFTDASVGGGNVRNWQFGDG